MMIRNIKLTLENCETITIDGKYIADFSLSDIRKTIARRGCNWIDVSESCHEFYISLHSDANKPYSSFGVEDWKSTVFERLRRYDDITSITIRLYDQYGDDEDDETKDRVEHYSFAWGDDGGNGEINPYQKSKVSKTGWLFLVIGKDLDIDKLYPAEDIDDAEFMSFASSMMELGDKNWEDEELDNENNHDDANEGDDE